MQIKAAKELQVTLISVWHMKPKCGHCFISTDMQKLVLNRALILTQIKQLSGYRSTKIFILVCLHIYAD